MSSRCRPFTAEDKARIRQAADLGSHALRGFKFRDSATGEREYYLGQLQDEVTVLRRLLDSPKSEPMFVWVSRDHLTVACGLLEELAARLEPPSAPITDATVGMAKLAREVADHYRSLGATIARPERSVEGLNVGTHMLSGVSFGTGTIPPTLDEQVSFARVLYSRNDRRSCGDLELRIILISLSLILELRGRLIPPSAPITSGTQALLQLSEKLSSDFDDLRYLPRAEDDE